MTVRVQPYDIAKRVLDVASSGIGLIFVWPVIVVVAILVAVNLGHPIIFSQDRPGKDGKIFKLYKFRTMKIAEPARGFVSDAERLTRFGAALRATSLDELPTLVNVLRGDMSVVGPRPLLVKYLDRYSPEEQRRHEVRPGITGLAQVNGRNELGWHERFALDVEYVDRRSLFLDFKILLATFWTVVGRRGVSAEGHATMAEFDGNPNRDGAVS
ncbi:sugar transferase [Mycetocola zhujimingii]|uniref:UDP-galactose phosphate transferase n=1 Tax=Mycetocola zhujimingii TaxID=2079792 RepID=A0A2U1TFJ6_9MICO|nr:sugar transferase [Mycetocola zhujimingii]PWC07590.1 UDP-galactose phosphate transferase [Mycetocola zhujimingii]